MAVVALLNQQTSPPAAFPKDQRILVRDGKLPAFLETFPHIHRRGLYAGSPGAPRMAAALAAKTPPKPLTSAVLAFLI